MRRSDWNGDVYIGSLLPAGCRINILENSPSAGEGYQHMSGVLNGRNKELPVCPNCFRAMFPVFDLDASDPQIAALNIWGKERLSIYVCPSCALYMKPYWVVLKNSPNVVGGERDGGEIMQDIQMPYGCRNVELRHLTAEDYPVNRQLISSFHSREHGSGVYHQIGGIPYRGGYDELECCCCGSLMKFAGCVDYDDLNVPLYEGEGQPVALIIGDSDCLNWFTCTVCRVVGFNWNH